MDRDASGGMTRLADEFAGWLQAQMKARDLSQEALARSLDVSWKTVQRWVSAKGVPSYEQLIKLAQLWGELPPPLHRLIPGG